MLLHIHNCSPLDSRTIFSVWKEIFLGILEDKGCSISLWLIILRGLYLKCYWEDEQFFKCCFLNYRSVSFMFLIAPVMNKWSLFQEVLLFFEMFCYCREANVFWILLVCLKQICYYSFTASVPLHPFLIFIFLYVRQRWVQNPGENQIWSA